MSNIIQTFGLNWYLIIAQTVNFIVILYILKRFVYKPVFSMLKKRQKMIQQSIVDSEKTKQTLENAEKERLDIIKKAHDVSRKILDDANKESFDIIESANVKAKKQVDVMMKEAHDTIERDARQAEIRLQRRIGDLIARILTKSLQDVLSKQEQEEIITKTLQHLPK